MESVDDSLIALNNLAYKKPNELSVVNQRHLRKFYALRQSYNGGEVCYVDLSLGSESFDPKNSFLKFQIVRSGEDGATASGSASNILRTVVIRSRSGAELDRIEHPNLHYRDLSHFECQRGWKSSVGSVMGWNSTFTDGVASTVCVPLTFVSPFFCSNSLVPSTMGTLRLEITLENSTKAFNGQAAPYAVQNLEVHCDSYQLSDAVQRRLQVIASQTGLVYYWPSVHTTLASVSSSKYSLVALKAASRALNAFVHVTTPTIETTAAVDSMQCTTWDERRRYQWNLGRYLSLSLSSFFVVFLPLVFYSHLSPLVYIFQQSRWKAAPKASSTQITQ